MFLLLFAILLLLPAIIVALSISQVKQTIFSEAGITQPKRLPLLGTQTIKWNEIEKVKLERQWASLWIVSTKEKIVLPWLIVANPDEMLEYISNHGSQTQIESESGK